MKNIFYFLLITFLFVPGALAASTRFSDVPSSHPNLDAIQYVKDQEIVDGYEDGTFKPDNSINRAEFTKIIMEAVFPGESRGIRCFTDVNNEWFAKYVCRAKVEGIISGYPDGYFKPAVYISFAEAAKIIVNAFEINTGIRTDDPVWYKPYVDELGLKHAIPMSIDSFSKNITRGEMAEIIYRLKGDPGVTESQTYDSILHPPVDLLNDYNASFESFDSDWKLYTDNTLGFSIKAPKLVSYYKCGREPVDVNIPTQVFHDEKSAYISIDYSYDWETCEKIYHDSLAIIKERKIDYWQIQTAGAQNDNELNVFIKNTFGENCVSGSKGPTSQIGAYNVKLDSSVYGSTCYNDSKAYVIKYYPQKSRIAYWFIEENGTWNKGTTLFDQTMIDSFKFE